MKNNPKITIITVVYNGANTLEQTIVSVLNQTYPDIEYIIVDGASTDGSLGIIKNYELRIKNEEFPNVSFRYISEPDKGIYDAMNKGIDMTTGEWINFMNADDTFCNDNILLQVWEMGVFTDEQPKVIYGDRYLKKINGTMIKQKGYIKPLHYKMTLFHQATFVSTVLLKQNMFNTGYEIAGDYDFFYRLLKKKVPFIKINLHICTFLVGGRSSNIEKQPKEVIKVIKNNTSGLERYKYLGLGYFNLRYSFLKKYFPLFYGVLLKIYRNVTKD